MKKLAARTFQKIRREHGLGGAASAFQDKPMICLGRLVALPWLDGRFWQVPHSFGPDVSLFRVDIPRDAVVPPEMLAREDLMRGQQLQHEDAVRFRAAHAVLRGLLESAVGQSSRRVTLTIDELGKPRLVGDLLRFNASRSGPALLIGISQRKEIGVDIEVERALPHQEALARSHLSCGELNAWLACDLRSRTAAFLKLWTRKEACVKAAGVGLAVPLSCVDVGIGDVREPVRACFRSGPRSWTGQVVSLFTPPGLFAAAAVSG